MTGEAIAFYALAAITLLSGLIVVSSPNVVHSAVALVPAFLGVTGIYILLNAEFVAGYFSEYSGMRFALFQLGEYGEMFAMAAMAVTLFLGGWRGPHLLPPVLWFVIKLYALIFLFMWVRWTYPRFRIDQLLNFSWKVLIPVALANLVVTAFFVMVVHP